VKFRGQKSWRFFVKGKEAELSRFHFGTLKKGRGSKAINEILNPVVPEPPKKKYGFLADREN
jgi:hypothetical protein